MKIKLSTSSRSARRGSAVIFILMLISIIVIFMTASFASVKILDDELKLIDKRQKQRIGQQPARPTAPTKINPQGNAA
jgi:hypothetical protein